MSIQIQCISSLEKVFPRENIQSLEAPNCTRFQNERCSFQVAYKGNSDTPYFYQYLKVNVDSPLVEWITIKEVGLVPSEFPAYQHGDDDYLTKEPGLFPDPLLPLKNESIKLLPHQWRTLWIEVGSVPKDIKGSFPITITFHTTQGELVGSVTQTVKILEAMLPEQKLIHTEWFHVDCISNYYGIEVYSERHWELIEKYLETACQHGVNMILTPLFTPPLDTEVGGERPTVQLIDVAIKESGYVFGFERLERWIEMCKRVGIKYYEMSHLFTQWGASSIPKIMGFVEGTYTQLFGWKDSARDERYKLFLEAFLPELIQVLKKHGISECCYFHISDEPGLSQLENYTYAKNLVKDLLEDFPIIDALSDINFYRSGAITKPIPSNDHIHTFIDEKVPNLWVYYCCSQCNEVSNRFMSMPSYRNRIIATQLFKYDMEGFLHWGYNFWNVQYSKYAIDPFKVTDAGAAFPSGDAFLVYPGKNEPVESIRLKVFSEALNDLRAMNYLADLTSREHVIELMEEGLEEKITFSHYPRSAQYIFNMREKINQEIMEHLQVAY